MDAGSSSAAPVEPVPFAAPIPASSRIWAGPVGG